MRCEMKDLGARSEGPFGWIGALVMNLWCDDKIAKVDCWLSDCRRHLAPYIRFSIV